MGSVEGVKTVKTRHPLHKIMLNQRYDCCVKKHSLVASGSSTGLLEPDTADTVRRVLLMTELVIESCERANILKRWPVVTTKLLSQAFTG